MHDPKSGNPFASPQLSEPMLATSSPETGAEADPLAAELANLPSRGSRLLAAIIDIVAVDVPAMFLYGLLLPFFTDVLSVPVGGGNKIIGTDALPMFLSATIPTFIVYLTFQSYLLKQRGQTIGKALLYMKTVRRNGERASYRRLVFVRYLPWLVFWYAQFFAINIDPVGPLLIVRLLFSSILLDPLFIFTKEKRCLHDYLAGTIVVRALQNDERT